jgi:hypothetical protein
MVKILNKKFAWKLRTYHWTTTPKFDEEHHYEQWQYFGVAYYFLGIKIWFKVIYSEEVPSFAWIQHNVLGFTDWKSKIPQWCHDINGKI